MKEVENKYDYYLGQVFNLLDDDSAFEEFESPVNKVDKELADETNAFIKQQDQEVLDKFVFNITSLITVKIMCDEANKNLGSNIGLTELPIFNEFYGNVIDFAELITEQTNYEMEKTLLYGFVYANFLVRMADTNKKALQVLKKSIIKPIKKYFIQDFNYAHQVKYELN